MTKCIRYISLLLTLIPLELALTQESLIDSVLHSEIFETADSLHQVYAPKDLLSFHAFPQARADYIRITCLDPDKIIKQLDGMISLDALVEANDKIICDKDLFIVKLDSEDYRNNRKIKFYSYEIGNNSSHTVSIDFDSLLFANPHLSGQWFYQTRFDKKDSISSIEAFFIKSDFKSAPLNELCNHYVQYADHIIGNQSVFIPKDSNESVFEENNAVHQLEAYVKNRLKRPKPDDYKDQKMYFEIVSEWRKQRQHRIDSLHAHDPAFKSHLRQAMYYARKMKYRNQFLLEMANSFLELKDRYFLERLVPESGSCSYDDTPIRQMARICKMSAELGDWPVFIRALIQLMNDDMSRSIDNSISAMSRRSYFNELEKLRIDHVALLLGISMKISDPAPDHYYGNSSRIGKAISLSSDPKIYLQAIEKLLKDDHIDDLNKLNYYNTIKSAAFYSSDPALKNDIEQMLDSCLAYFSRQLRNRIEDPNLELRHLLTRDSLLLEAHFTILSSSLGNIYSSYARGDAWLAEFEAKNYELPLTFLLFMQADTVAHSIKKLSEQYSSYIERIQNHGLINELIQDTMSIKLFYVGDKSFSEKVICCDLDIPPKIKDWYTDMFDRALMLKTHKGKETAEWILFENGDILLTRISDSFEFENYVFSELMQKEVRKRFGKSRYYSYRLFDRTGVMFY